MAEIYGTAAHVLDFDDLHVPAHLPDGAIGHPSAPVIGALLPLAETRGASGRDFLTALVSGIETECRVGLLVAPGHYAAGWHSTATVGTFGATAACAHLLKLGPEEWLYGLGLAGMQAQGLKSMFGTMAKSFQVGKAASNGLESALLAARGYTSSQRVLEDDQGFCKTQSSTYREILPQGYEILKTRFKKYACCGGTHPTLDAVEYLLRQHALTPSMIKRVVVRVNPARDKACNIQWPKTPLEGKFSLRFVTAVALAGKVVDINAFTEKNLKDHAILRLMDRITVTLDEATEETSSAVSLELTDGRVLRTVRSESSPMADKKQEWRDLVDKFMSLTLPTLGRDRSEQVVGKISQLEKINIQEIMALTRP